MLTRVPIVALFVAAACGAGVGFAVPAGNAVVGALVVLSAVLAGSAAFAATAVARGLSALAFAFVLAAGAAVFQRARFDEIVARLPAPKQGPVVVEGDVVDAVPGDEGQRVRVQVDGALVAGAAVPLGVVADVALLASRPLRAGDRVRLRGVLRAATPALSPGTFDGRRADLSRGVHAHLTVRDALDVAIVGRSTPSLAVRARTALQTRLQQQLPPRLAGLLLALLIGDTSLFEEEQIAAYRHVGAGHLLAVSGLQVTLLASLLSRVVGAALLLSPLGRRGRGAAVAAGIALCGVWGFVAVCGSPPSAVRAAIMASSVVVASVLGRRILLVDALAAAGLLTVVAAPASVLDPGFLLSYAAVLGLVAASARPFPWVDERDAASHGARLPVLKSIRDGITASVVAGLVTVPLSAWLFAQVAPAGLLANVVLVPAASVLQLPALVGGVLGAVFDVPLLSFLGAQAALLLEALVFGLAGLLPGVRMLDAPPAWLAVSLTLSTAGAAALVLSRRRGGAVVVIVTVVVVSLAARAEPAGLRVTFLPVGQGDSAVVELPDGRVFVIDGGGRVPMEPGLDEGERAEELAAPGTRVVVPFLRRRGIERVDVMVLSHPHPDHAGGLRAVLDALPVEELWWAGDVEAPGALVRPLVSALGRGRVKSTPALLGRHTYGDVVVDVLAPAPRERTPVYPELHANDNSLVVRFCLGSTCALFPGDVERFGEELLLAGAGAQVRAQLVKAPHHGSSTSSTPALVEATGARDVVFCTGRDNRFGFPSPAVVERWRAAGARVWDTARDGEVTAWLDGRHVTVRSFASAP